MIGLLDEQRSTGRSLLTKEGDHIGRGMAPASNVDLSSPAIRRHHCTAATEFELCL